MSTPLDRWVFRALLFVAGVAWLLHHIGLTP